VLFPAPASQDGYFIEEVAKNRGWVVESLPIKGLNSLIFHGPSPLYCIAGGNVWYDNLKNLACLSHKEVAKLYPDPRFDWHHYHSNHAKRFCLRLSREGDRVKSKMRIQ
jgi:hypothetical protein